MATTTTATLANTYQTHFSKKLLAKAVQEIRLNEFAATDELPKNVGSKQISFFRPSATSSANVQTLVEGTPINVFRDTTFTKIDATLVQLGEAAKITDVATMTAMFKMLQQNIDAFGEECALKADDLSRDALNAQTTGLQIRRAAGAASFAALNADAATSYLTAADLLDARTLLKSGACRARPFGDTFVGLTPPEITRDLMKDPDWLEVSKYAAAKQLFKGEVGTIYGVRIVEATNPFVAKGSANAADEFTYDLTGTAGLAAGSSIFTTMILGKEAFGVPKLAGTQSPWKPQVIINDKADKSDPLNQFMVAGWKAFYTALVLNTKWGVALKSKSRFTG